MSCVKIINEYMVIKCGVITRRAIFFFQIYFNKCKNAKIYTDNPEFGYRYIYQQLLEDGFLIINSL